MKRIFDVALVLLGAVVWLPVLLIIAAMVLVTLGRPILFRQVRAGLHGRPFTLIKFRTMHVPTTTDGPALSDAERLTRFGRFLRSTSLDELPELWNVLIGDMSLVGPRPLLTDYLPLYSPRQARRHEVRPGITGWAQVNGRNSLSWPERFDLDVWYVDNRSLRLDARILFDTLLRVVRREDISPRDQEIMPRFTGAGDADRPDATPPRQAKVDASAAGGR